MTYARKKDTNHNAIGNHLRSLGYNVLDLWRASSGIPDLCVCLPGMGACLVEVKRSPSEKLTPAEQVVRDRWEGWYVLTWSPEDAEKKLAELYGN